MATTNKAEGQNAASKSKSTDENEDEKKKKKGREDEDLEDDEDLDGDDDLEDDDDEADDDDDDEVDGEEDDDDDEEEESSKKRRRTSRNRRQRRQESKAKASEKTFTQKDLDRIITKRLEEAKKSSERKSEIEAKKKKGEFESLAKTFEAERDQYKADLDKSTTTLTEIAKQVDLLINVEIKRLPEILVDFMPDSEDPLVMLQWLQKAKRRAAKMALRKKRRNADEDADDDGDESTGKRERTSKTKRAAGDGGNPKSSKKTGVEHTKKDDEGFRNRLNEYSGF